MRWGSIAFLCLIFVGCVSSERDQQAVRTVMLQRQQALRSKDLNGYLTLISPHYQSKGQDFAAKTKEIAANFASFDGIDYRSNGYDIAVTGNDATVSGTYLLKVVMGGQVVKLEGQESIHLHKEGQEWHIVSGL